MYYRKKMMEDFPQEQTKIWSCSKEDCKGWMRDNFTFAYTPTCRICHSPMVSSLKLLPIVVNSNGDLKLLKNGVQISGVR
ncbi:cold-shock protein [Paenibacillus sp. UNC451MF]|uniref:cold-shock protein n=1 Tax=Paenibacillus sp. UNC451MF TaxID=1449063 RepID=UPI00049174AA|nr:cold-shock protein [Paenibacillus sp. UNC451MF]